MKRYLIIPMLAVMLLFASCGKEESSGASETTAETLSEATRSQAASTAHATTAQQTTAPEGTTKAESTTAPSTTKPQATSKPVQDNIPPDTITAGHVNPYLGYIQGNVINEINELAVTGLSLARDSVTLDKGDTAEVEVTIEPSNAANKRIAVATDSSCVKAEYKSGTLYLTALKEGRCNVTLTSHNGLHVGCVVTVNGSDKEDIPEETTEPATEPATEPSEEPTE